METSNCCGAKMSGDICLGCKEHCEPECTLSPDCKCEDCQEQNELNLRGETYS
jgi:hypothetical protein